MNSVQWPCSPSTMSFHISVDRVPAQCLGGHGFDSCRGLRLFLCSMLVLCWSLHFSHQITIFIEESKSALSWFLCGSSVFVELEFAVLVLRDENQRNWRKTLGASRKPTRYSTQISYGMGLELNLGHISGRWALSPLHHSCFQQTLD